MAEPVGARPQASPTISKFLYQSPALLDMNIDHKLSHGLFNLVRSSWVGRHAAILAGTHIIWMMLGVLLAVGAWYKEPPAFTFDWYTLLLLVFLLPAWGVTMLLSRFVNRERPFEELHEKPLIDPFVRTPSFPSAHATLAFSMATICLFYFQSVLPYMLGAAIVVALGRVAAGLHFFSDILMGALVGFIVTLCTVAITILITVILGLGYGWL